MVRRARSSCAPNTIPYIQYTVYGTMAHLTMHIGGLNGPSLRPEILFMRVRTLRRYIKYICAQYKYSDCGR
jgi:hypothetical protein